MTSIGWAVSILSRFSINWIRKSFILFLEKGQSLRKLAVSYTCVDLERFWTQQSKIFFFQNCLEVFSQNLHEHFLFQMGICITYVLCKGHKKKRLQPFRIWPHEAPSFPLPQQCLSRLTFQSLCKLISASVRRFQMEKCKFDKKPASGTWKLWLKLYYTDVWQNFWETNFFG